MVRSENFRIDKTVGKWP